MGNGSGIEERDEEEKEEGRTWRWACVRASQGSGVGSGPEAGAALPLLGMLVSHIPPGSAPTAPSHEQPPLASLFSGSLIFQPTGSGPPLALRSMGLRAP